MRLAAKFGPDIFLSDLLERLTADCQFKKPRHPYQGTCRARFTDLQGPLPPDLPPTPGQRLVVLKSGRAA